MEGPLSSHISNARDSNSRASYSRASSRTSNGAQTSLRMAQQERYAAAMNANGARASPAPSSSTENSARFRSSFNDAASIELKSSGSRPSLTATSSYLQEKLQREKDRKVESERSSSRQSDNKSVSSTDVRSQHLHTPTQPSQLQQQLMQQTAGSPARPHFDISRPRSSTGHLDSTIKSKKAGVGLKEMEQTLTNLHKQNFDLKLELYHRREKQTTLEERCESLEAEKMELELDKRNLEGEKHELEEINDKLMSELEMRDKAVEEAVAMIVSLEARLDELLNEREMMAKQAEEEEQFFATDARLRRALTTALDQVNAQPRPNGTSTSAATRSTKDDQDDTVKKLKAHPSSSSKIVDDFTHTINRMPSFVSERSELTENLRNVYLGTRVGSSIASLSHDRFQSMDGAESDIRDARVGSPALSVLSESSFLSIYGKKKMPPMSINISSAPTHRNDKRLSKVACVPDIPRNVPDTAPSVDTSLTSSMDSNGSGETYVNDTLDITGSAANVVAHALASTGQKIEVPEARSTTPRKRSNAPEYLGSNSPLQRVGQMDKSKQDKRDALRRVRTDAPFLSQNQNSQHSHNLPPTPDTISTSTLRRFKTSSETLANSRSTSGDHRASAIETYVDSLPSKVPPSNSFVRYDNTKSYFGAQLSIPPRPRSAGETTVSHHGRGSVWDSESSDGDDMDIDGNDSVSVQDYWLRESLRPIGQAPTTASRHHRNRLSESNTIRTTGRVSPDLFSFPATANGWATTAMFGPVHSSSYNGPDNYNNNSYNYKNAPLAQKLDALGDSLPAPAAGLFGAGGLLASSLPYGGSNAVAPVSSAGPPPPPHRRSSLHAQTGSMHGGSSRSGSRHGTAPGTPSMGTPNIGTCTTPVSSSKTVRRSPGKPQSRAGTMSTINVGKEDRPRTAAPVAHLDLNMPKQRHYPPAAGGNTASRNRVLSLFRRSGSHEVASPTTEVPPDTDGATSGSIGMPSRVRGDDDHESRNKLGPSPGIVASSTPPPIMRNPRMPERGSVDGSAQASTVEAAEPKDGVADAVQAPPQEASPAPAAAAPGQRMKWLGRVTSLRNRAG